MESYVFLWTSRSSTVWLRMIRPTIFTPSTPCQTQHNTWQESFCSANKIAPSLITVSRWRTNGQWNCLHLFLLVKHLLRKDWHKLSAYLCLPFKVSCVSTWTQPSKLTNELKTWTTLELQPTVLRTLPGTSGQSSSAFIEQDWNWQKRSAIWESDMLNS